MEIQGSISLDLENLIDSDNLKKRQYEAEKTVEGLTHDDWVYRRRRAKTDLFFLCYGVLGFKKLSVNLHGHLCNWLHQTDNDQFREILLPRSHYKSTVLTIGDSIRIALPDDVGDSPWPRNLGPNSRIVIGHEIDTMAGRFLGAIQQHFMSNPILMGLFPECVPIPRKQRINTHELELPRQELWAEPTFDTFGVGARSQGRHYNFLKLDDLFGAEARDSATLRAAVYDWFDNIQAFFSSFNVDHFDLVGTRWGYDDLYSHAHHQYGPLLKKYIRGVEEKGEDGIKRAIFPEEFSLEKLGILRRNPKIFNAQYANDPTEGGSEFEQHWKKFYTWENENRIIVEKGNSVSVSELDKVILIDPAMSGNAGYVITGGDGKDRQFIIKAKQHNWKPPELVDELFKDVVRWNPRLVVIEAVLFSELFQHWIIQEQATRGIRFRIEPARTRQRQKEVRVRGLSNYFSAGLIYMHESQVDLIEQFDKFGAIKEYHILDALGYGPEYWRKGRSIMRSGELANSMMNRDSVTGYSTYNIKGK